MPLQDHASTPMHASEAMTDVPMNREAQHAGASPAGALHVETREEGFFHYVAREGRVVLRWVMVIAAVCTVITMMSPMLFLAPFPAGVLLAAYLLLLAADQVERRSDAVAHAALERREVAIDGDKIDDHTEDDQVAPVPAAIIRRESMHGAIALGAILVVALVYAAIKLPWEVFAIGAFVVFCYMIMVAAPVWLGHFESDIEIQQHRMENKPEPAKVRTS